MCLNDAFSVVGGSGVIIITYHHLASSLTYHHCHLTLQGSMGLPGLPGRYFIDKSHLTIKGEKGEPGRPGVASRMKGPPQWVSMEIKSFIKCLVMLRGKLFSSKYR